MISETSYENEIENVDASKARTGAEKGGDKRLAHPQRILSGLSAFSRTARSLEQEKIRRRCWLGIMVLLKLKYKKWLKVTRIFTVYSHHFGAELFGGRELSHGKIKGHLEE